MYRLVSDGKLIPREAQKERKNARERESEREKTSIHNNLTSHLKPLVGTSHFQWKSREQFGDCFVFGGGGSKSMGSESISSHDLVVTRNIHVHIIYVYIN